MNRKLATVDIITDIKPIPGADRIEAATVRSWESVIGKGQFQIGDTVIYIESDAFLPIEERFEFLRKSCYATMGDKEGFRLRIVKLKKQISHGLIIPLDPEEFPDAQIGDDLTEALGIVLFEKPIPEELKGKIKGYRPHYLPDTGLERIQNLTNLYEDLKQHSYFLTEKLNGWSCQSYLYNGLFGICSRNMDFILSESNVWVNTVKKLGIEEKLRNLGRNLAIQGELVGPGIEGNYYELDEIEYYVYNVFDIDTQQSLSVDVQEYLIKKTLNLQYVPIVNRASNYLQTIICTFENVVTWADGVSFLCRKSVNREGLVFRSTSNADVAFKVISNKYLLKQES